MMTSVTSATTYHHGDLPNALRRAAVEVIEERGLGAFSLREVARRAGVSHTAPAHHFGDMRGLLTSVAIEGFDIIDHYGVSGVISADAKLLSEILARHAKDVIVFNLAPILVAISARFVRR